MGPFVSKISDGIEHSKMTENWDDLELETKETQREKLPAKGARKPNADEQERDFGSTDDPNE